MLVIPSTTCWCGRLVHAHVSAVSIVDSVIAGGRVIVVAEHTTVVCVMAKCGAMVCARIRIDVVSIACSRIVTHVMAMCPSGVVVSVVATGVAT